MSTRSRAFVSPRDLAAAVDVSESSLKRWADAGRLQVVRTAGGHRRIPLAEAVRFVREARLALVDPGRLGLPDLGTITPGDALPTIESLVELFGRHQGREVERVLLRAYLAGVGVAELADGPIRGSMEHVGRLYEDGPEGIAVEHGAVDACIGGLSAIRQLLIPPSDAPVAAGGAVVGDPYILPTLSVAMVLEEAGFRAINVGPNTPIDALDAVVRREGAMLVWRSFGIELGRRAVEHEVEAIESLVERTGCDAVLGGRAWSLGPSGPSKLSFFSSLRELSGYARGLLGAAPKAALGVG